MAVWLALVVFVVGLVAGLAVAIVRGLRLWRQLKRTNAAIGAETARITKVADEITRQLERAQASGAHLNEASERLRVSVARLRVQQAAYAEARAALERTFWFVPGL